MLVHTKLRLLVVAFFPAGTFAETIWNPGPKMNASIDSESDSTPEQVAEDVLTESRESPRKLKPARRFLLKLALLMFGCLAAFFFSELLLIAFGISFPLLYQPDDFCGTRLRPNLNVRYIEEGIAIVKTNSSGFRGVEFPPKQDDVFRIAVVGDSFTEAIHVPFEESYGYLLERQFETDGRAVEILNFGVSGFGTAQELEMLKHYVLPIEPDLVILAVFTGNDIGDNSPVINRGQIKPYFHLEDGDLILDDAFKQDSRFIAAKSWATQTKAALINSSRSLQLANKFYASWKRRNQNAVQEDIGLDPNVYLAPTLDSDWDQAWKVTERLILHFSKACKIAGANCLVVTLSNPIQVHPDQTVRDAYFSLHGVDDPFYPDARIAAFCESNSIPVLSLAQTFLEKVETENGPFLHGFPNTKLGTGHWNDKGHAAASKLIYAELKRRKLIKQNGL